MISLRLQLHCAPSALWYQYFRIPGALPQAVTFRAFGALRQSFAEDWTKYVIAVETVY
jgi:hypothetical protein